jgi:putative ABC transport system ATP-binding protein
MAEFPIVKLENVWKIYKLGKVDVPALRGVNLEIKKESFISIIGPSGSGKSTFLHLIGCLDLPSKGKIFLDGKDIKGFSENQLATIRAKKLGFVFQQFNLLQNLTALENVALPMAFLGIPEKTRKERSRKLLQILGLEQRVNHRPFEMSGGEQQRVALARALSNDPEMIVADEPTGNLDSKTGKKIMDILKNLHQEQKKTIVVVTHDPNIASYSEEVVSIKDGAITLNHFQRKESVWR